MLGGWNKESGWNGKEKETMRNMHGGGGYAFLMPHTECAHRQAPTQISSENPTGSSSGMHLIGPTGRFSQKQSATGGARASRRDAAYTDTGLLF